MILKSARKKAARKSCSETMKIKDCELLAVIKGLQKGHKTGSLKINVFLTEILGFALIFI